MGEIVKQLQDDNNFLVYFYSQTSRKEPKTTTVVYLSQFYLNNPDFPSLRPISI